MALRRRAALRGPAKQPIPAIPIRLGLVGLMGVILAIIAGRAFDAVVWALLAAPVVVTGAALLCYRRRPLERLAFLALGVVVGKLIPYLALAYVQLGIILLIMVLAFRVPIHGSLTLLLALSFVYLLALLSLGMLVSSRARTQAEAIQRAMSVMLPSVLLSGYIFPLSALPAPIRAFSQILPATLFIAITRGIVLRAASFMDLWEHVAALAAISFVLVLASSRAFQKTIR